MAVIPATTISRKLLLVLTIFFLLETSFWIGCQHVLRRRRTSLSGNIPMNLTSLERTLPDNQGSQPNRPRFAAYVSPGRQQRLKNFGCCASSRIAPIALFHAK
jgi:hypothetical protein